MSDPIQRWDANDYCFSPSASGVWVRNADHLAAVEKLEAENARLRADWEDMRDCILFERGPLAESGMSGDQINDVLGIIDDHDPARAAEPKEEPKP